MSRRGATSWVLGVSASHNGSACLLRDGEIFVAVQEERLSRRKRDRIELEEFSLAVEYCLRAAAISPAELKAVCICRQGGSSAGREGALLADQLKVNAFGTPTFSLGHHAGHMLSAIALSGCSECAGLVIDGLGSRAKELDPSEQQACLGDVSTGWESISLYACEGAEAQALEKHLAPHGKWLGPRVEGMRRFHSLGGMYSSVAEQIFGDASEAGHVMGLAPYGRAVIAVSEFFEFDGTELVFTNRVCARFPHEEKWPARADEYRDLAASVQAALEVAIMNLSERLWRYTGTLDLCFAGGVALNAVVNERLQRETPFRSVFVPAAAEDSGPAIGAAYHAFWRSVGPHVPKRTRTDGFGAHYSQQSVSASMREVPGLTFVATEGDFYRNVARRLADGEICGWFQRGSELGPRALGNRSILADPRSPMTKDRLNKKVKFRASFRPFAPAILQEHVDDWFETAKPNDDSDFMLRIWPIRAERRALVPAIVHHDGTGRAQTVKWDGAPEFYALLSAFNELTGVPILVNTSFNVSREPIVETPEDALWCFLMTDIDFCVVGDQVIEKAVGRNIILDLVPQRTQVEISTSARNVGRTGIPSGNLFRANTRWGPVWRHYSPLVGEILKRVDGAVSVRALGELLASELPIEADDAGLIQLFSSLKRVGLVTFSRT